MIAMIGGLGAWELMLILLAIVMLFGLGKLPQAAKQLGVGVRNFQKGVKGEDDDEPKKLERASEEARVEKDAEKAEA